MTAPDRPAHRSRRRGPDTADLGRVTNYAALRYLIQKGPGRTEAELATAIFGPGGYPARISFDCRMLALRGLVRRRGAGGAANPFRYYPASPDGTEPPAPD